MNKRFSPLTHILMPAAIFLIAFSGILLMDGCKQPVNQDQYQSDPAYSVDDLHVDESLVATPTDFGSSLGSYSGKIIKVTPNSGVWHDWDKPVYYDLGNYSGLYKITISMSVWLQKPLSRMLMYTGPSEIIWLLLNGTNENGSDNWTNFCGPPLYVPGDIPAMQWQDLEFSEYVNIADSGTRMIYLDGLNEDQGLVDLTLYFRNFKVSVEPVKASDKIIALTFDDGPFLLSPDQPRAEPDTISLLDKLESLEQSTGKSIKVSFFLNGMRIDARDPVNDAGLTDQQRAARRVERQKVVKRMYDDGDDVANHSYSHNYLGGTNPAAEDIDLEDIPYISGYSVTNWPLNEDQIRTEIQDTQDAIQKAIYGDTDYLNHPTVSKFFRTPFTASQQPTALKAVTTSMGLPMIYGYGSLDYDDTLSVSEIADSIYDLRAPYAVIINHDPRYSPKIIEVLDNVIPRLIADGYSIVSISQMEKLRGKNLTPGHIYESLNPDLQ